MTTEEAYQSVTHTSGDCPVCGPEQLTLARPRLDLPHSFAIFPIVVTALVLGMSIAWRLSIRTLDVYTHPTQPVQRTLNSSSHSDVTGRLYTAPLRLRTDAGDNVTPQRGSYGDYYKLQPAVRDINLERR